MDREHLEEKLKELTWQRLHTYMILQKIDAEINKLSKEYYDQEIRVNVNKE
uniref:Uncharacterized protein n=1 Tax=viral metagenome TaxID=1070528 RepID=A0A6M3LY78_9ZZZZ